MASCPVTGFDCLTCDEATCRLKSRETIPPADPIAAEAREAVLRLAKSCRPTRNTPGTVMEEITLDWHFFQRIVCELELSMKSAGRAEATSWLIERWIANQLHYWCAGARGRGFADDWATDVNWAVRFARKEDATKVLYHVCNKDGRVAEHAWIWPLPPPPEGGE